MSLRPSGALLAATAATVTVIAMCSACSALAASPAASVRHSSAPSSSAVSPTVDSSLTASADAPPLSSPAASTQPAAAAPTKAAAPTHAAPALTTVAPAPTKTTLKFSNSDVTLAGSIGHAQNIGANIFMVTVVINVGIGMPLSGSYGPVTVCEAGAPTATFQYLGADNVWHTVTRTGDVAGDCFGVGQVKILLIADDETGSGTTLQTKLLSVSLRLTGPNGAWTATG